LAALVAGQAAPTQGGIDARIAGSAAAVQGLQGPMDGSWSLIDSAGRVRFLFQIVDPAGGSEDLQAAWREPSADGALGAVSMAHRTGDQMVLDFDVRGAPARVRLRQGHGGMWRGTLRMGGGVTAVRLRRPG
jgi:hypothetical protein